MNKHKHTGQPDEPVHDQFISQLCVSLSYVPACHSEEGQRRHEKSVGDGGEKIERRYRYRDRDRSKESDSV